MYIGRLLNTDLISVSRPPIERCFPFQLLSYFSKRSSIIFQSEFRNFLKWIGMPRYFSGRSPCLQPNKSMYISEDSWALPKQKSSLLWKLILTHEICSNAQSRSFMLRAFSRSFSIKIIVSSAYCKIDNPPSIK